MPPTPTTTVTATVAIITDELPSSGGPATGHVVLGVLGGLVLVLIVVVVTVPLIRSRIYGKRRAPSEKTQSRASSRRTHVRIPSGREVAEPLLEGKGNKHLAVTGQWQGTDVEAGGSRLKEKGKATAEENDEKTRMSTLSPDTPIRPPSAVFNWKILTTLPNFSDESLSSLGEPLEPGASNLSKQNQNQASTSASSNVPPPPPKQDIPTLEVITATNTTASTSRQSTLVADKSSVALVSSPIPLSPDLTSPLTHAFTGPLSSTSSLNTHYQSTFRYPSLSVSTATTQGASSSASAAAHQGDHTASLSPLSTASGAPAAIVIPDSLQAGKNVLPAAESWWHIAPPMPSIPESSRSPSTPSSDTPDNRTSSGTARLRELFVAPPANVEPGASSSSGLLQVASSSAAGGGGSGSSDSRRLSMAGSIFVPAQEDNSITRQLSAKTHYTFGRPNSLVLNTPASENFIPFTAPPALPPLPVGVSSSQVIPAQNTVPFPASSSPGHDQSFEAQQRARQHSNNNVVIPRSRFSTPTMSSNGADPDDVSRKRQSYDYPREPSPPLVPTPLAHPPSRPSPVLKPQAEMSTGDSSATAVPSSTTASSTPPASAPLRTPKLLLRPVSPLGFDDTLFSVSRTQTPAPGVQSDLTANPSGGAVATTSQSQLQLQQGTSSFIAAPPVPILPPPPPGKKRRARRKSTSSSSYSGEHSRTASSTTTTSGSRGSLKSRRSASASASNNSMRMSRRVTFGIPPDTATRATFAQQSSESTAEADVEPLPSASTAAGASSAGEVVPAVAEEEVPTPLPFVEPLRLSSPRRPGFSRAGSSEPRVYGSAPTSPTSTRPSGMGGRDASMSPVSPLSPASAVRRAIRPLPKPPSSGSPGTSPPLASPPFAARNEEEQPLISGAPPDYDSSL